MPTTTQQTLRYAAILAQLTKAIAALQASKITSMVIETVTYAKADVIAKLEAIRAPLQAVVDTRNAYDNALTARDQSAGDLTFLDDFYTALPAYVGSKSTDLESYGKKLPKTRVPQTVEQKQVSNEKRQATRAARHIMGKKQRAAIKAPAESPAPAPAGATAPKTGQ